VLSHQLRIIGFSKEILKPDVGAGIGSQRGFLKSQMEMIKSSTVPKKTMSAFLFFFSDSPRTNPSRECIIQINIGDMITPWLKGVGIHKTISKPVLVHDILIEDGIQTAITEDGERYSSYDIVNGLSEQEKNTASLILPKSTVSLDHSAKTIQLSELRTQIMRKSAA